MVTCEECNQMSNVLVKHKCSTRVAGSGQGWSENTDSSIIIIIIIIWEMASVTHYQHLLGFALGHGCSGSL